jgi:glycosyltransferase involved in cell wall biosynthesis
VGFAIGRLVGSFYEMALRLTGDPASVHVAFTRVDADRCAVLPPQFRNLLEFNPATAQDVDRLAAYVRAHDIALVFGLDVPVEAPFLGPLRKAGVRLVVSYCGAPCSSLNRGLKLALKRLEVAVLRRHSPDAFIFESEAMRQTAVRGRGIPRRRTHVVRTGVDVARFAPMPAARAQVYDAFAIPRDRKIIVYMGHLHERKGVQVLLDAADRLVAGAGRRDVHFLFLGNRAGDGEAFRDRFDAVRTGPHVTFGGYHANIPQLLAGCYAGCIPSTGWDSYPMSSLEMQACGLPVIASDLQGVPETIEPCVTGVVVRAGDADALAAAIARLVDAPEIRDRMSAAARVRIASSLTRDHQIARLTETVHAVISNSLR